MKKGIHLTDLPSKFVKKTKTKLWVICRWKFHELLDRRANVFTKLVSTHYRRSPLLQGAKEIPCVVTVSMPGTVINQLLMERYKQLVETLYMEPKGEEILGTFLQLESNGEQDLAPVAPTQKKK